MLGMLLLVFTAFSQIHGEYVPNENFEPAWFSTEDEPAEGPDFSDVDGDLIAGWLENYLGTDGSNYDTDNDGMNDGWEFSYGLNPNDASDAVGDVDTDFITNLEEYQYSSDPNTWNDYSTVMGQAPSDSGMGTDEPSTDPDTTGDSDGDGMTDSWENSYGLNAYDPNDAASDSDSDFISNLEEYQHSTDPNSWNDYSTVMGQAAPGSGMDTGGSTTSTDTTIDTDGDGMPDYWEITHGLNPQDAGDIGDDADGDFILNIEEYQAGTDPQSWNDFWSVMGYPIDTSSLSRQNDGTERDADWDGDGRSNLEELLAGSDPRVSDTEPDSSPQNNTNSPDSNGENNGNSGGDPAAPAPATNEAPAPTPAPPPVPEPLPPPPEPSPPVPDPTDLPWYQDVWNGVTNFVETYIWSSSPVDAATFEAIGETSKLVDPLVERQQAIQGLMENFDNAATGATNPADPADYTGSNGTVEPN